MESTTRREYDFRGIEAKWRKRWEEQRLFEASEAPGKESYYALCMFPYPSGAAHVGHARNYTLIDAVARFQRSQGKNVICPFGWDAFGLPAENAAIKTKVHPKVSTFRHIDRMREQFKQLGFSFDWSREVFTCREDYYKWTQWLFTRMMKMPGPSGQPVVYRRKARVNWCPHDMTVLANEQVVAVVRDGDTYDGCERCGTKVEQRELWGWFFRITDYADELLAGIETLRGQWPDFVLALQHDWIGRSEGVDIHFAATIGTERVDIPVFTTRADTLFGVTFLAIAVEHPLVPRILAACRGSKDPKEQTRANQIEAFIKRVSAMDDIDRSGGQNKEGIETGVYAEHPLTGERVPVFIGNYVLMYGTGAVMAVPAHDQRDFEFAKRYKVAIKAVIEPATDASEDTRKAYAALTNSEAAFTAMGTLRDSQDCSGLSSAQAIDRIADRLKSKGKGGKTVNFKIRDWGISRQRYWGCPIPVVHCETCGPVPVPDDQLPVRLPDDVEFIPTGRSPLETHPDFQRAVCPACGATNARRETDTMDTFVDSSWYWLRYCDPHNERAAADPTRTRHWLPVTQYIGGSEHAILHLIYARFFCRVMRDLGLTEVSEPFSRLFTNGMILKESIRVRSEKHRYLSAEEFENGRKAGKYPESDLLRRVEKMSKSAFNTVDPETLVKTYGADTVRAYGLFIGPAEQDCVWDDSGVVGVNKFIRRWWEAQQHWIAQLGDCREGPCGSSASELRRLSHLLIDKATRDYAGAYGFNTCIAKAMELVNFLRDKQDELLATPHDRFAVREALEVLAQCLGPIVPHLAEELWEQLGHAQSLVRSPWPVFREELTKQSEAEIALQVNGKVRGRMRVPVGASREELESLALANSDLSKHLAGVTVRKVIVVPGRNVNVVVG